jgi:hypothetical protein
MVRVDSKKPCKLVYSLCKHPYMGFVIEPHIVQLNANGSYSLSHQKLYSQTAKEFDACLDEDDYKLIKLLAFIKLTRQSTLLFLFIPIKLFLKQKHFS